MNCVFVIYYNFASDIFQGSCFDEKPVSSFKRKKSSNKVPKISRRNVTGSKSTSAIKYAFHRCALSVYLRIEGLTFLIFSLELRNY